MTITELFLKLDEKQKENEGAFATYAWIGSGIYLGFTRGWPDLLPTILFFVVGMFVAAIFFGNLFYGLARAIAKIIIKLPHSKTTTIAIVLSWILAVFKIVVIYLSAEYLFEKWFLSS